MTEIETTYQEQTITYSPSRDEAGDKPWIWQETGRCYATLIKAQTAIDRANGNNGAGKPKFQKRPALYLGLLGRKAEEVTVTGEDESTHSGEPTFWITKNGKRSKEGAQYLLAATDENLALLQKSKALREQARALEEEARKIEASAQSFADWLKQQEGGK